MHLILNFDGGSRGNPGPAGCGVVLIDDAKSPLLEAGYFLGRMTNNAAEYTGLLRGLEAAERAGVSKLQIYSDSELLVRQVNGEYRVKNAGLKDLYDTAFTALRKIGDWKITHVYREGNSRADELANMAMDAGEDVIVIDNLSAARPASKRKLEKKPASTSFTATCQTASDSAVCPAPCRKGTAYTFDRTVPADLCIHAARAILDATKSGAPSKDVTCGQPGCGAEFKL